LPHVEIPSSPHYPNREKPTAQALEENAPFIDRFYKQRKEAREKFFEELEAKRKAREAAASQPKKTDRRMDDKVKVHTIEELATPKIIRTPQQLCRLGCNALRFLRH